MHSFLQSTAKVILEDGRDLKKTLVVLPGKRAAIFLRKALHREANRPLWTPEMKGMNDFIVEESSHQPVDKIESLFTLYKTYCKVVDPGESLETFLAWGSTLISDFDDIDRYLVDTNDLFKNLSSVKELEDWEIDDWSFGDKLYPLQQAYSEFWDKLGELYTVFDNELAKTNKARTGKIYRETAESISEQSYSEYDHIYFCGLNALSKSEAHIIDQLVRAEKASCIWDTHKDILEDPVHEAGFFMRNNIKINRGKVSPKESWIENVKIHRSPNSFTQCHIAASLLDRNDKSNTVVVMCDESLLNPMIRALPDLSSQPNISAEFSLSRTPIHNFCDLILRTCERFQRSSGTNLHFKDVVNILNDPIFQLHAPNSLAKIQPIIKEITEKNMVFLNKENSRDQLGEYHQVIWALISKEHTAISILTELERVFEMIADVSMDTPGLHLIKEQLFHYEQVLNQVRDLCEHHHTQNLSVASQLIRLVIPDYSLSYSGEPLEGVQIIGMLETRSINFRKVVFVGANEGHLPGTSTFQSFIPYDLRAYFGLPLKKNREAIHAYYFYRQLWHAEEVHIIYNGDMSGHSPKEPSRYLRQLEIDSPKIEVEDIEHQLALGRKPQPLEIPKSDYVLTLIRNFLEQGISPSAIKSYLNCPVDFYHKQLLRIRDPEELEEDIKESTIGTIMHNVLQRWYQTKVDRILTDADFSSYQSFIRAELDLEFIKNYGKNYKQRGRSRIAHLISFEYLSGLIEQDVACVKQGNELIILGVEKQLTSELTVDGIQCKIKGTVDRIDKLNGVVRIIDYKTGSPPKSLSATTPEEAFVDIKYALQVQLMIYEWLYSKNSNHSNYYSELKYLRSVNRQFKLRYKGESRHQDEVENQLKTFIRTLLDPSVNFVQNNNSEYPTLVSYPQ